jgi:hypothetical protein
MSSMPLRLAAWFRRSLYGVLLASWLTGSAVYVMSRWLRIEGPFGPERHPLQQVLLEVHGACAFGMLMAIGGLAVQHVPAAWRTHRSRKLGVALLLSLGLLVVSGWGLYYVGSDTWRPWLEIAHAFTGFALPLLLGAHVVNRRGKVESAVSRMPAHVPPAVPASARSRPMPPRKRHHGRSADVEARHAGHGPEPAS